MDWDNVRTLMFVVQPDRFEVLTGGVDQEARRRRPDLGAACHQPRSGVIEHKELNLPRSLDTLFKNDDPRGLDPCFSPICRG